MKEMLLLLLLLLLLQCLNAMRYVLYSLQARLYIYMFERFFHPSDLTRQ